MRPELGLGAITGALSRKQMTTATETTGGTLGPRLGTGDQFSKEGR
jgi:hypothetical protein